MLVSDARIRGHARDAILLLTLWLRLDECVFSQGRPIALASKRQSARHRGLWKVSPTTTARTVLVFFEGENINHFCNNGRNTALLLQDSHIYPKSTENGP